MGGMKSQKCGNCMYFTRLHDDADTGACRRYPPAIIVEAQAKATLFPATAVTSWCGEWRKEVQQS